ncbi:MAG: Txe/YoeB family addiction module toxin [Rickettsiales bacterium]|nr:Txe/YoeB family addiction module toxin [Rickettsiales bacterium]
MRVVFYDIAWEHHLYWQDADKKILKKLNALIKECQRTPYSGTGQPEALKYEFSGWWSRRITQEHRLVYRVEGDALLIAQCRYHY